MPPPTTSASPATWFISTTRSWPGPRRPRSSTPAHGARPITIASASYYAPRQQLPAWTATPPFSATPPRRTAIRHDPADRENHLAASCTSVKSTITVTATAADNVGVVGVQSSTTASISAPKSPNRPIRDQRKFQERPERVVHLTAVARDAAGNKTTSAPISVKVGN